LKQISSPLLMGRLARSVGIRGSSRSASELASGTNDRLALTPLFASFAWLAIGPAPCIH